MNSTNQSQAALRAEFIATLDTVPPELMREVLHAMIDAQRSFYGAKPVAPRAPGERLEGRSPSAVH